MVGARVYTYIQVFNTEAPRATSRRPRHLYLLHKTAEPSRSQAFIKTLFIESVLHFSRMSPRLLPTVLVLGLAQFCGTAHAIANETHSKCVRITPQQPCLMYRCSQPNSSVTIFRQSYLRRWPLATALHTTNRCLRIGLSNSSSYTHPVYSLPLRLKMCL